MNSLEKRIATLSPKQRELLAKRLKSSSFTGSVHPTSTVPTQTVVKSAANSSVVGTSSLSPMKFSLFFFSDNGSNDCDGKYRLLLESAKYADRHGFHALWTPERHFHEFGGPYPNPSILAAALATVTEHIQLRAGSVVLPLHHPVRVAEEWSVIDNLSGGRVGISYASGWHPEDFILSREPFDNRKEVMFRYINVIQQLWAGEAVAFQGEGNHETIATIYPSPIQAQLPFWVTSSGNPQTWIKAAEVGANVLTGLMEQTVEELKEKIALYRKTLAEHGHNPDRHQVTVMLHTFLGDEIGAVKETVKLPLMRYLRTHLSLYEKRSNDVGNKVNLSLVTERDRETLLNFGFERYFNTSALLGTSETCLKMVNRLQAAGVNEIGCLINFGLSFEAIMASLEQLNDLKNRCSTEISDKCMESSLV